VLFVHEFGLGFLEPVEGVWGEGVFGFVGVDEEGLFAVDCFDVGFGDAGFEAEDRVARGVLVVVG
jgi:hypothetical protein